MTKRVLMLAYFFPPMAVSGAMRPAGFCAHLEEFGYVPHVLSTPLQNVHPPVQEDVTLGEPIPPGVLVTRLPYVDWRQVILDIRNRLPRSRRNPARSPVASKYRESRECNAGGGLVSRIGNHVVDTLFVFPDQQKGWAGAVMKYVRRLPPGQTPDIVYATGSPWSSLIVGGSVAGYLGVPFVADFRDPWLESLKPSFSPALRRRANELQRSIIGSATRVIANTDALRKYFVSLDPANDAKTVALTNGFHASAFAREAAQPERPAERSTIEIGYFGSISRRRLPRYLLAGIARLHDANRLKKGDLRVSFTGQWTQPDPELLALIRRLEHEGYIALNEPIPHAQCLRKMAQSDYLLILQQGFPMQIPAKIFEYMAAGRPLIVLGGEGATAELVRDKSLGIVCADRDADIEDLLESLVSDRNGPGRCAHADLEEFEYRNLTRRLAAVFDDAIADYSASANSKSPTGAEDRTGMKPTCPNYPDAAPRNG